MADIEILADRDAFDAEIRAMSNGQLQAQTFMQQGAIHALSFLLTNGCDEETVQEMLASMRANAATVRAETIRRGMPDLFEADQVAGFH